MPYRELFSELRQYALPIFCGNTRKAHRLSAEVYRQYSLISLIYGKKRLFDIFDVSSYNAGLPHTENTRLICEALTAIADSFPDMLILLIPMTPFFEEAISEYSDMLESRCITVLPDALLDLSPLSEIADAYEG